MSEWERDRETHREKIELDREVKHWLLKEIQRVSVLSVLRVCLCVYVSSIRRPLLEKYELCLCVLRCVYVLVCVISGQLGHLHDIFARRFSFFEYEGLIFYSTFSSANRRMPIEGIVLDLCDPLYGL